MRRIMTLVVVAAMMALALVAASPAFAAVPEDFLSNVDEISPEALNGLEPAAEKTRTKPSSFNILKLKDKASSGIFT